MQLVLRRPESGSQKSFFVKINQTQEVFIMDFRHSYVYIYIYIYASWLYKNIPKFYHKMLMFSLVFGASYP